MYLPVRGMHHPPIHEQMTPAVSSGVIFYLSYTITLQRHLEYSLGKNHLLAKSAAYFEVP